MDIFQAVFFCILISVASSKRRGSPSVPKWGKWSEPSPCVSLNCTNSESIPFNFQFRWCVLDDDGDAMCRGPHLAALPCFEELNCAVNGMWNSWSEWECNRGGRIAERKRECNNPPPKNGGKRCNPNESTELLEEEQDKDRFRVICKVPEPPKLEGSGEGSGDQENFSGDNEDLSGDIGIDDLWD